MNLGNARLIHHQIPDRTALVEVKKSGQKFVAAASFYLGDGAWVTISTYKFDDKRKAFNSAMEIVAKVQSVGIKEFFDEDTQKSVLGDKAA